MSADNGRGAATGTATTAGYAFHPLANKFPMLGPEVIARRAAHIKAVGQKEDVVLYEGMILDGRHIYRACLKAGLTPRFRQFGSREGDGDDPWSFVMAHNLQRRRLDDQTYQRLDDEDRRHVLEMRGQGVSIRKIAAEVGVHPTTVQKLLDKESPAGGDTPDGGTHQESPAGGDTPDRVVGKDGKSYPATGKRGKRGPNKKKKGVKSVTIPEPPKPEDASPDPTDDRGDAFEPLAANALVDGLGREVPPLLRDVAADTTLKDIIFQLEAVSGQIKKAGWDTAVKKLVAVYPHINASGFLAGMKEVRDQFALMAAALKSGLFFAECPACHGTRCPLCAKSGHVPEWRHPQVLNEMRIKEAQATQGVA